MRLALLVGSAYKNNGKLAQLPSAPLDLELVERRLSEPDAGFRVLSFEAERGLAERIEQRLLAQTEPIEQLLVYFSGYCVLSAERGPALLLDGERLGTFALSRLRALFQHFSPVSCLIVDAAAVVDGQQTPADVAEAIGETLTADAPTVSALVAVRDSERPDSFGGSAFTGLLLMVLDWLARDREAHQPVDVRWLFHGLRADPELRASIPAAGLFGEHGPSFVILPVRARPLQRFGEDEPKTQPGSEAFAETEETTPVGASLAPPFSPAPAQIVEQAEGSSPYGGPDTDRKQLSLPPLGSAPEPAVVSEIHPAGDGPDTDEKQPTVPPVGSAPEAASPLPSFALADAEREDSAPSFEDRTDVERPLPSFAANDAATTPGGLPAFSMRDVTLAERLPSFDELDALPEPRAPQPTSPQFLGSELEPALAPPLPSFDSLTSFDLRAEATGHGALPSFADSDAITGSAPEEGATSLPAFPLEPAPALQQGGFSEASEDELLASRRYVELSARLESLLLLSAGSERAAVLARLARVRAMLGQGQVAAECFAQASELDGTHLDVLRVRAEWAESAADHANLLRTADAWLALAPHDRQALAYSARAAEALGQFARALEAYRKLARHDEGTRAEKAGALRQALRIAELELSDDRLGNRIAAELQAVLGGVAISEELDSAPATVATPLDFAEEPAPPAMPEAAGGADESPASGTLAEAQNPETTDVRSSPSAMDALREARALEQQLLSTPQDEDLRERVIDLYASLSDHRSALEHCRAFARLFPTRVKTYRRAQVLFEAAGILDGAWNAASVLECLGEADINESLLVSQHKPEGLLAARTTIAHEDWPLPGYDDAPGFEVVLKELDEAGVRVGIGMAKQAGRYAEPDPASLQDPEKSTTMLAKTLAWTARLLGMSAPQLYVSAESEGLSVAPVETPAVLASRALGSGLGLGELAFLWGRQLPRLRAEMRALSLLAGVSELSALVTAASVVGGVSELDVRALDGDSKRLYAALRRELRGDEALARLRDAVSPLAGVAPATIAQATLRRVELLGVRMGLLACGDVAIAADLIRRFPEAGVTSSDEQLAELYSFAISERYCALRERIGVAIAA